MDVAKLANRAKREVMAKFPPAHHLAYKRYTARLDRHRSMLPGLSVSDASLVDRLNRDGIVITSLDELDLPDTAMIKDLLAGFVDTLASREPDATSRVTLDRADLVRVAELWRWGLGDRLLDIAENHIGTPINYYGPHLVRQIADGRTVGNRRWHRDIEDHSMVKMLVWLNDVGTAGGPFEYISLDRSAVAAATLNYPGGYVDDDTICRFAPRDSWRQATGPQWTVLLVDTSRLFHRGMPPRSVDRYSVTFTWTSRRPIKIMPAGRLTTDEVQHIEDGLSPRQIACLPSSLQRL